MEFCPCAWPLLTLREFYHWFGREAEAGDGYSTDSGRSRCDWTSATQTSKVACECT